MTRVCIGLLFLLVATSCGGSASETPPPLEPDYERLEVRREAKRARFPRKRSARPAAVPAPSGSFQPLLIDTWGGAPRPAPSASSDLEEPPF